MLACIRARSPRWKGAALLFLCVFGTSHLASARIADFVSGPGTLSSLLAESSEKLPILRKLLQDEDQEATITDTVFEPRTLVEDTTEVPFSFVGILRINGGAGLCTGGLIRPNFVLTAGHCALNTQTGLQNRMINFIPGYDPKATGGNAFKSANIINTYLMPQFTQCTPGDSPCFHRYDVAVLELDTSYEGWFGVGFNESMVNLTLNTAGYPGDLCTRDSDFSTCSMYTQTCTGVIPNNTPTSVFSCLSYGGQSGSPIWTWDGQDTRIIRGILTSGPPGLSPSGYTIITEELYQSIASVIGGSN